MQYNSCYQLLNVFYRCLCSHLVESQSYKHVGGNFFLIVRVFIIFAGDSAILNYSLFF